MSVMSLVQYVLFLLIVGILVKPVGIYLARVFANERTFLDPVMRPVERGIYRLAGVDPTREMRWRQYAVAFLCFSLTGTLLLYLILRVQQFLPWYDAASQTTPLTPDLAANTAISFATTTTWQAYGGETTMSYFTQIVGLAAQNFLAGAAGLAVGIAFIRGFARERTRTIGNFWCDLVRAILWVLLPLSLIGTLVLVWQGVPLNWHGYTQVTTLEGGQQIIAQGPVAALEFIKNLGTNGGGFFNANGAHPYENPTPLTNLLEMLAIAVLPAALTYTFGRMVGRPRQGWMLFWSMTMMFSVGLCVFGLAEQHGTPAITPDMHITQAATATQAGGNMEGKETRFGIGATTLTAITTSNGATGSYNAQPDSYTPVGGMVALVNMMLGEIIFGGLGTGIYSIILIALVAVFLVGLMIGRTPEYLGKKITPPEMKLIVLYTIIGIFAILPLAGIAVVTGAGKAGLTTNNGAHGLTEVLFAYVTSFANNGQNFAGLSANTPFYNYTTAVAMFAGRFALAVPALAVAGIFVEQRRRQETAGTLETDTPLFASVLIATAVLVGALSYLPALVLGPMLDQLGKVGS